jgi:ethanolamine utilization protein EutQ (cupin superfamily)
MANQAQVVQVTQPNIPFNANVQVVNSVHSPARRSLSPDGDGIIDEDARAPVSKPRVFTKGMNVRGWIIKLENYLNKFNKKTWLDSAIGLLDEKCFEDMKPVDQYRSDPDGYEKLKQDLLMNFRSIDANSGNDNEINCIIFRTQYENETVGGYAQLFTEAANKTFGRVVGEVDHILQDNFAEGLFNQKVREATKEKKLTEKNKRNSNFKIKDLIDFAVIKDGSIDKSIDFSSCSQPSNINMVGENQNNSRNEYDGRDKNKQYQHRNQATQSPNNKGYYFRDKPKIDYKEGGQRNKQAESKGSPGNPNDRKCPDSKDKRNQYDFNNNDDGIINYVGSTSSKKSRRSRRSKVYKPIRGKAIFNNTLIDYQCDNGADRTIINKDIFEKIMREAPETSLHKYTGVPLKSVTGRIQIKGVIVLDRCIISPESELGNVEVIVVDMDSNNQCLVGRDIICMVPELRKELKTIKARISEWSKRIDEQFYEIKLVESYVDNPEKLRNNLKFDDEQVILFSKTNETNQSIDSERKVNFKPKKEPTQEEIDEAKKSITKELEEIAAKSLVDLKEKADSSVLFKIELINPDQEPIRCKMRPLPYNKKEQVKQELEEQLNAGVIRRSKSQWCAPLKIVDKPDGKIRITVDYKPVNRVIKGDNHPLPSVVDLYNKMSEAEFLSKIDLKYAYHQLLVELNSIQYTAFICEFGLFEYLRMPMGIKNAPAFFQRAIEECLRELIDLNVVSVYLDDTILFTSDLETHVYYAKKVVEALRIRSMKVSLSKSVVVEREIQFLGHVLGKKQIKPNPDRAQCFLEKPRPRTLHDLQVWMGVVNYYRRFIDGFAQKAKDLYALTGTKEIPTAWRKKNGVANKKK